MLVSHRSRWPWIVLATLFLLALGMVLVKTRTSLPATRSALGDQLVRIEPGVFQMGRQPEQAFGANDESLHQVRISNAFLLGATEVTQGLWTRVMGSNPAYFSACGPTCPVENIDWFQALGFCNRLSEQEGLEPVYRQTGQGVAWDKEATGFRLPTEAEWEYAAWADQGFREPPVEELRDQAWYLDSSGGHTHPVAQLRPNGWGLYDMRGNVLEWVWDWYGPYRYDDDDPAGPPVGRTRVRRGGSWFSPYHLVRATTRFSDVPRGRCNHVGMRIARNLGP